MFRLKKNQCGVCSKVIADGFEKALNIPKMKPNTVTKKKGQFEDIKK